MYFKIPSQLLLVGLALSSTALMARADAATLGITSDGRFFTINGAPTFLNGLSYYAALSISTPSFVTQDLDDMVAAGFNWVRVWVNWSIGESDHNENISVFSVGGAIREPYLARFKTLVAECNNRGIIVDCTFDHASAGTVAQHQAAVQMVAQQLLPYRNVYIDVGNERDVGDARYLSLPDCGTLITAVKVIDPQRICTASSAPGSQSELNDFRNIAKMDFIAPHLCRDAGCPAQTVGTVRQYITWMQALGFRMPIHMQEPFRRGYTTYNPTVEDFYRDDSGARMAEAAGWCLHNGSNRGSSDHRPRRSFDLCNVEGRLFSQWDSVEQVVAPTITDQIGGTSPDIRRYQAEYAEQLSHQTGAKDSFAWTAAVAAHSAGYLSYGPNITTVPAGQHSVAWRMRIDSITGANDTVVRLDVARASGSQTLAVRDVRRQDFTASNTWQDFTLSFLSNAGDALEFRTYWYDTAGISLDWVTLTITPLVNPSDPPIIDAVSPNPQTTTLGTEYVRQLLLTQGTPPVTWSLVRGPTGAQVDGTGRVNGWTPTGRVAGVPQTFAVMAENAYGSDPETWQVLAYSAADYDRDGDVDQADFAGLQNCLSGAALAYADGCSDADLDGDGDVDEADLSLFLRCMGGAQHPPSCDL